MKAIISQISEVSKDGLMEVMFSVVDKGEKSDKTIFEGIKVTEKPERIKDAVKRKLEDLKLQFEQSKSVRVGDEIE
jgi:hypothetical protein